MRSEMAAIARGVTRACKDAFVVRFDALESRLLKIEGDSSVLKSIQERIASIKDGEPGAPGPVGAKGDPGKDADPTAIEALKAVIERMGTELAAVKAQPDLLSIVKSVGAEMDARRPAAEPISEDAIQQMVKSCVKDAVALIPAPTVAPEDVRAIVAEHVKSAVSELPKPKDGDSIDPAVVEAMVVSHIAKSVADLPKPENGKSVTVQDVLPMIAAEVKKAVDAVPKPQDGARGADGASVDPSVVEAMVVRHVEKSVAALPKPQDGRSLTPEDVAPLIAAEVTKAVDALPVPENGKPGADGVSIADALIGRDGELVLTMSNGVTKMLGRIVGQDGANGADGANGRDGINLDFFTCEITRSFDPDTRTFTDRYAQGDRERVLTSKLEGSPIYKGVYKSGQSYEAGDVVSYNHVWIAKEATSVKPEEHSAASAKVWTMLMRRGNRGEQGKTGDKGETGQRGPQGDRGPAWQS